MATTVIDKPAPAPAPKPPRQRRSLRHWLDFKAAPYVYVAPFFLVFGAFGLYPLIYTGWISLHEVELQTPDQRDWVGFGNYTELLGDDKFWNALTNTFTIGVISTVPQLCMALGLAHLLNYKLRGSTLWRVAILTPYATSVAAATLVFALIFGRDFGMINWFLDIFGVNPIDWESGKWTSQIAISTIVTWRWTGYNALIYLAAMQAIPQDRYEAASIDGASRWQQFRHVTVPSLRPTILFTIVVSTIGATQLFGEPLLFGGSAGARGGTDGQYQTLGVLVYQEGWSLFHFGNAAAVAWLMFLILLIIAAVNAVITRYMRRA
ncbi:sugar ABC transporter permease [Streptomyces capparidis]